MSLTACRKESDNQSSNVSAIDDIEISVPQNTTEFETQLPPEDNVEKTVYQSTVIVSTKVTFYKEGMQSVSTDKELNHKIAKHIESWFYKKENIPTVAVSNVAYVTDGAGLELFFECLTVDNNSYYDVK